MTPNDHGTYCEHCDSATDENDWMPVTRGYEQRYVCPNCGAAGDTMLTEDSTLLGDYFLATADEDGWWCGFKGAQPPLVKYEA